MCVITSHSQSWQWGKRGGSTDVLPTNAFNRQEEVSSIVTDSEKNIYTLSTAGKMSLNIDGHPKTNYGDGISIIDFAVASFACDGSYRWSKVFGTSGSDLFQPLQIDGADNIYIAGKFGGNSGPEYAQHIDEDIVFSVSPVDYRRVILMKYDRNGILQWYKKPEANTLAVGGASFSKGLATDTAGNSYWLLRLQPGVYADGAFENTMAGDHFFIFKYDADGNFLNSTFLNFETTQYFLTTLQFFRNPYTGQYYINGSGSGATGESAIINGQAVTHSMFLASFDVDGQFL